MTPTNKGRPSNRNADRRLTRRAAVRGTAAGLATALAAVAIGRRRATAQSGDASPVASPGAPVVLTDAVLRAFEADVRAAMQTFQVPGAAVAIVQGNEIAYIRGFGARDLESNTPVTPRTRFRVGSITKSMTSMLLATLADDGVLGWDDRAVDLWPAFRAPTPELTESLKLRDLLGMGSGIAESVALGLPVVEFFMLAGTESPADVLRSVADLPVIAPPGTTFSYNNSLVATAAYLGLLAAGTPTARLGEDYAAQVRRRLFDPLGMAEAAIADDPRPLGDDYAVGYTRDIFGAPSALPFVSLGGIAPAGSGLASATDLARYLIAQINGGIAPDGTRVVSGVNLAATHRPGVLLQPGALGPPQFQPDTADLHYGLGWLSETFRDGRRLLWHGGGIDGFDSWIGFFPDEKIGLALLTNLDRGGGLFNVSVQASLLSRLFTLNQDLPGFLGGAMPMLAAQTADLAAQARPVDPAAVAPFLGLYEEDFRLRLTGSGGLRLDHDIRSMTLLALPGGSYVVADGPEVVLEQTVTLATAADGTRTMTIAGFEPVRWLTGG